MFKVTFDSNVWEKVVRKETSEHEYINNQILLGNIQPYISEIAISLESLQKKKRLEFMKGYSPKFEFEELDKALDSKIHGRMSISPNLDSHLGLHPRLKESLELAEQLGFKVIPMTNLGTVRSPEIPNKMKVEIEDFWSFAEKLYECSNFIAEMGCGSFTYFLLKKALYMNSKRQFSEKEFSEAIAEWVDGDMLSAHYAIGNDFFCTEDRGKNAGKNSVMFPANINKVIQRFDIKVCSLNELIRLLTRKDT
ncbi:hypothetical protein [Acinetobacter pittii]|uniref:hypothetical protein n=1 Tax=Acinetobacter pittii TaxID=48296 RepID=UPI000C78E9F1|nr:hypothetical protein [Acinetobacter pittii]AUM27984.1 hypothetical protein BVD86_14475 [Acinetobacter pittii]MBJ8431801.1 hypothetical protein [Acinetobacter pittii]MEC6393638.1 hypothetical protein [Acinetobacter pittii]